MTLEMKKVGTWSPINDYRIRSKVQLCRSLTVFAWPKRSFVIRTLIHRRQNEFEFLQLFVARNASQGQISNKEDVAIKKIDSEVDRELY